MHMIREQLLEGREDRKTSKKYRIMFPATQADTALRETVATYMTQLDSKVFLEYFLYPWCGPEQEGGVFKGELPECRRTHGKLHRGSRVLAQSCAMERIWVKKEKSFQAGI